MSGLGNRLQAQFVRIMSEKEHITNDGVRLRYAVHGCEGPAVVLVRP